MAIVKKRSLIFSILLGLVLLTQGAAAQTSSRLIVFAAASMQTALDAIAPLFAKQSGTTPAISYGSSGILAKQIEHGAPAEVFISANVKWMNELEARKLLAPGTRRDLLGNSLVLIEPADARLQLKIAPGFDLAGAADDGRIAVCTVESCPAGIYAKEALQKLGVWGAVQPKLAQGSNVRDALNLVARGEAKLGIVYLTDAKAEPRVKVVDVFPAASHSPIIYPAAIIAGSKNPAAAAFLDFLATPAAVKVLQDQGFAILHPAH
ncbi:MAG: molybdate ABC transporter substrate-binding protein [Xanthobacteraceae bacterium]